MNEEKKDSDDFRHSKCFKKKILPKIAKNSLFFVNKIDLLEDKDKEIKSFKENMLKNKLGIDLSNNYIDNISSTQLIEER